VFTASAAARVPLTGTPMLMKRSGHTSVRSLTKYAQVSAEALMRHRAEHDPARRW
jgi:integrase/recombinase XerC/integrase/recombinase XerD